MERRMEELVHSSLIQYTTLMRVLISNINGLWRLYGRLSVSLLPGFVFSTFHGNLAFASGGRTFLIPFSLLSLPVLLWTVGTCFSGVRNLVLWHGRLITGVITLDGTWNTTLVGME
jgi:hypothetical protein